MSRAKQVFLSTLVSSLCVLVTSLIRPMQAFSTTAKSACSSQAPRLTTCDNGCSPLASPMSFYPCRTRRVYSPRPHSHPSRKSTSLKLASSRKHRRFDHIHLLGLVYPVDVEKTLDRNNKRVKNVSGLLKARLQVFEQIREAWQSGHGTWLAMDFESWERDHTLVTEFGWASVSHRNNENLREQGHFKIKYKDAVYANGTFVADNREVSAMIRYIALRVKAEKGLEFPIWGQRGRPALGTQTTAR
jgi:hypothetical protein